MSALIKIKSSLAIFISQDPKGFVDGFNLYAYVKNNPLKYTDPFETTSHSNSDIDDVLLPSTIEYLNNEIEFDTAISDDYNNNQTNDYDDYSAPTIIDPTPSVEQDYETSPPIIGDSSSSNNWDYDSGNQNYNDKSVNVSHTNTNNIKFYNTVEEISTVLYDSTVNTIKLINSFSSSVAPALNMVATDTVVAVPFALAADGIVILSEMFLIALNERGEIASLADAIIGSGVDITTSEFVHNPKGKVAIAYNVFLKELTKAEDEMKKKEEKENGL